MITKDIKQIEGYETAKIGLIFVTSMGATKVVKTAIEEIVQSEELGVVNKVLLSVGTFALAGAAGKVASEYMGTFIDYMTDTVVTTVNTIESTYQNLKRRK